MVVVIKTEVAVVVVVVLAVLVILIAIGVVGFSSIEEVVVTGVDEAEVGPIVIVGLSTIECNKFLDTYHQ